MLALRLWMTAFMAQRASSFAPHPSARVRNAAPAFKLPPLSLFGKKNDDPVVEFVEDPPPTEVYASRMSAADGADLSSSGVVDTDLTTEPSPSPSRPSFAEETDYDVIVVGGGCAGLGTALMLTKTFGLDDSRVLVVERGEKVGTSFRAWPEEMRFISPSFNQQGWTQSFDLNSICWGTSPASLLRAEHPSGEEYALYLEAIAEQSGLQVRAGTEVTDIEDAGEKKEGDRPPGPFRVNLKETSGSQAEATVSSRYIVWAAGEFQFPKDKRTMTYVYKEGEENTGKPKVRFNDMFPGAELCLHNSHVRSWAKLPGDDFLLIGGYESGVDAAYNLAKAGKTCRMVASTPTWCLQTGDPSSELAPYTAARLREVLAPDFSPRPKLFAPLEVVAVVEAKEGGYDVAARWKGAEPEFNDRGLGFKIEEAGNADSLVTLRTPEPPILCTGFEGSVVAQAADLFHFPTPDQEKKSCVGNGPLLTRDDESTRVPGVFLVGPSVTHGELSFCFVYKFRQRFAVVADAICQGLGMDTRAAVEECRRQDMYLDNFATCEDGCGDMC
uniref:FAD/NAD(P)-binding domain-containing protein n=1 Tax=Corethron hystrix TaxID=216773 RepID=A0A7S1FV04_9STRA|mmetsp:Transcript_30151/g.69117  ORF Transcript_30151/g.69117 Transcript_30151/m.69117 type:complete len:555 (+) Transcript_30151:165-1829(+)